MRVSGDIARLLESVSVMLLHELDLDSAYCADCRIIFFAHLHDDSGSCADCRITVVVHSQDDGGD